MKKFVSVLLLTLILSLNIFAKEVSIIVFKQNFLNQTSGNQTITLFTPTETSLYRINFYAENIDNDGINFNFVGGVNACFNFVSSKGNASTICTVSSNLNGTIRTDTKVEIIRILANNPVSVQITTGNPTPSNYDFYVTIEE